jgi:hypothetical protein
MSDENEAVPIMTEDEIQDAAERASRVSRLLKKSAGE